VFVLDVHKLAAERFQTPPHRFDRHAHVNMVHQHQLFPAQNIQLMAVDRLPYPAAVLAHEVGRRVLQTELEDAVSANGARLCMYVWVCNACTGDTRM